MIISRNEVKTLLQITDATKDDLIDALIPILQDDILAYLNNNFKVPLYRENISISFDEATNEIRDSENGFTEAKFSDAIHVIVEGSKRNDGIYYVNTVTAGVLTIGSGKAVVDEAAGEYICVTKIMFPDALKLAVSRMIAGAVEKASMNGIKSESIGDYSITYLADSDNDFRLSVLKSLNQYRRPKV
jgi:hypothetical protein